MKEFTRVPTRGDRILAIVLCTVLCLLFGSASLVLAHFHAWVASAIFAALLFGAIYILRRAAYSEGRAIGARTTRILAWIFVIGSLGGLAIVAFLPGTLVNRLLVLNGSIAFLSYGLAGIKGHRQDA